jgi:hypothetical protein
MSFIDYQLYISHKIKYLWNYKMKFCIDGGWVSLTWKQRHETFYWDWRKKLIIDYVRVYFWSKWDSRPSHYENQENPANDGLSCTAIYACHDFSNSNIRRGLIYWQQNPLKANAKSFPTNTPEGGEKGARRLGMAVGWLMPCSFELLVNYDTVFFSHNKTTLASLSAVETINQTWPGCGPERFRGGVLPSALLRF